MRRDRLKYAFNPYRILLEDWQGPHGPSDYENTH